MQMVPGYIIITVFIIIFYYAVSNENTQFAATASAIRQVWSGGCRLSCRPSQMSGLSGLPGEVPCQASTSNGECVCDTCPCAIIENLLRTCSPATRMYTNVTDSLSHYYYHLLKSVVELYEYASRVFECGASCQRQAQIVGAKEYDSSENFNFGDQNEKKAGSRIKMPKFVKSAIDLSKIALTPKKSSISFKEPVKSDSSNDDKGSDGKDSDESISKDSKKSKKSDETLKPSGSSGSVPKGYCSKCVEEGKTCISECPRAKKH